MRVGTHPASYERSSQCSGSGEMAGEPQIKCSENQRKLTLQGKVPEIVAGPGKLGGILVRGGLGWASWSRKGVSGHQEAEQAACLVLPQVRVLRCHGKVTSATDHVTQFPYLPWPYMQENLGAVERVQASGPYAV